MFYLTIVVIAVLAVAVTSSSFFTLESLTQLSKRKGKLPTLSVDSSSPSEPVLPLDPDVGKDMVQIVQARGYEIETHYVTTQDGYILTMFRIPNGRPGTQGGKISADKPVVLLQHGLLDSSYTWVNNFADQSLGYILADSGYDVWFGNNRGNRYGRNHTTLNPDDGTDAFWSFTWDQMAAFDVPALINYVYDVVNTDRNMVTGYKKLAWVGHSEGTIQMFAAGSITNTNKLVKNALSKLNLFVALAPVAYVGHLTSPALQDLASSRLAQVLLLKGVYEFLPYGPLETFAPQACRIGPNACNFLLGRICGPSNNLNTSRLQVYVSETPAGTSTMNMAHWMQGVVTDAFMMYDYGSEVANLAKYGQRSPPVYNLTQFQYPPVALFTGGGDYLADPLDVDRLVGDLPPATLAHRDDTPDYAHLDFTWAVNAKDMIYDKVINVLKQYNN